jgi:hypothetical protein
MIGKITVKLHTEVIAEYENYVVLALYVDGKFSSTLTIDLDEC